MSSKLVWSAGGAAAAYIAYAAACPASQRWGRGFHRGPGGDRRIALTLDDGPSEATPAFLDLLDRHGVRATFFLCGQNVERLPETARRISRGGHEIGNHTYTHPPLLLRGSAALRREIGDTQRIIEQTVGERPRLFRPPYGVRAPGLRRILPEFGLTNVLWTVIGNDWRRRAPAISRRLLAGAGGGGILCLHDGEETRSDPDRRETLQALETVIPELKDRGFRFVAAGEMGGPAARDGRDG